MLLQQSRRDDRGCRPFFRADWDDVAFVHFAIEPGLLQPRVPFELDCREGMAYLSLVAFTQRNLRPIAGGRIAAAIARPVATHPFLNVRTYVREKGIAGIHFLCEWIPNRLAALIGPPLYGLPYRLGQLRYEYWRDAGIARHQVNAAGDSIEFDAQFDPSAPAEIVRRGSLDEFLLERYVAFTQCRGRRMCFQVGHAPWEQRRAAVTFNDLTLLWNVGFDLKNLTLIGGNYSTGLKDVWLSAPQRDLSTAQVPK